MYYWNLSHIKFILRWVPLGLIPLSWVLSLVATASCSFISVDTGFTRDLHFGFNNVDSNDGCESFNLGPDQDHPHAAAFTFAVANCLLTTVGVVGIVLMHFVLKCGRERTWLALRIGMYVSLWCCLFSFHIRSYDACEIADCSLGGAGIAQVFNVLVLIAICAILFVTPFWEKDGDEAVDENTKEEVKATQPEGVKVNNVEDEVEETSVADDN